MLNARPMDDRRLFRHLVEDALNVRRSGWWRRGDVWHPSTDVYETEQDIVIKVSIPGVDPGRVRVACDGEAITITGYRGGPDPCTVRTYHQVEIRSGYFERRIVISRPFDPRQARAEYVAGFLYIYVPKAREVVRQVLAIQIQL